MSKKISPTNLSDEEYAALFKQSDKEAALTALLALTITAIFWLSIYFSYDKGTSIFNLPWWFIFSCLGGYLLSILGVIALVKFGMRKLPLH